MKVNDGSESQQKRVCYFRLNLPCDTEVYQTSLLEKDGYQVLRCSMNLRLLFDYLFLKGRGW